MTSAFSLPSRLHKGFPYITFSSFQQKNLYRSAGVFFRSHETRRQYFRIIQNKAVSRFQIINNVPENFMLPFPCFLINNQQS